MEIGKFILIVVSALFISLSACKLETEDKVATEKPRLIVCTDIGGYPDDRQSLVRLLLYSNEFDIEAIITSSSGTPGEPGIDTVQPGIIHEYIDAYSEVYPMLMLHSSLYPDPGVLSRKVIKGNRARGVENIGKGNDSEASEAIIAISDMKDERIINISIWGGQTDLAQALWKVKNSRSKEEYGKFISKLRIYDNNDQDELYTYLRKENPGLFYILSKAPENSDQKEAVNSGMYLGGNMHNTTLEWINENIIKDHGPLGSLYPDRTRTEPNPHGAMKEEDTPSWFYFLENGLQDADHPEWGGWGGRFMPDSASFYRDAEDFGIDGISATAGVYRWREYYQNDFEARMDWCTNDYEHSNHPPVVIVSGDKSRYPLMVDASPGEYLTISAYDSYDPDNDGLDFYWWTYPEAGTNQVCPELENNLSPEVSFLVPEGEEGNDIHLICEVSDKGSPVLTGFRRIIVRIR